MKMLALGLFGCWLCATVPYGASREVRVLLFGDSLAASVLSDGASASTSFAERFETVLAKRLPGCTVTVIRAGRGGERASEGSVRLASLIASESPSAVVLWTGANDLLAEGRAGVPRFQAALRTLLRLAHDKSLAVIVLGFTPQRRGGKRALAIDAVAPANEAIVSLHAEEQFAYWLPYDTVAARPDFIGEDGLHLTAAGYAYLGEQFAYDAAHYFVPEGAVQGCK